MNTINGWMMMSKLLYITANPKMRSNSLSLQIGEAFIQSYAAIHPSHTVTRLDLYKQLPPGLDEDVLAAREQLQQGDPFRDLNAQQQQKLFAIHQVAEQFVQADKYVFVSPVWNWGLPPVLKMYLDAIVVPDKTLKWTMSGPLGLLSGKKALHIETRGYQLRDQQDDFSHRYLKYVLNRIGVDLVELIRCDRVWEDVEMVENIMDEVISRAERSAIEF
jgi:FMN-dependent NADH-azoreductase